MAETSRLKRLAFVLHPEKTVFQNFDFSRLKFDRNFHGLWSLSAT